MEGAVPSVASGEGMPWPYCGNSKRRKERCHACAKYSDRLVFVTWAQAGMPVLLFFVHEGQPIVTRPGRVHPGPYFPGCKNACDTGNSADVCHHEKSSDDDSHERWRTAGGKPLHA